MKRASLLLLSRLSRHQRRQFAPILSRSYISVPIYPPLSQFQPCIKSNSFKTHPYLLNPCRNIDTLVGTQPQMSSRQKKLKEKSDVEEAFDSAQTIEEMISAFKAMESCCNEKELGLASLKIGQRLDQEGEDPQNTLSFATRALNAFDCDSGSSGNSKNSLLVAMALKLIGSANYSLKRLTDSLGYLNRAYRVLSKLEMEGSGSDGNVRPILHAVMLELANVKTAMGRREEAIEHLRKCLDIKEMMLEKDSKELGVANRDLAEAYVSILNFKEALAFGLKALDIHKSGLGNNSVEVAHDRRLLGVIYSGLGEHLKAFEQNELSKKVLKNWGRSKDLLQAEIDASNMQLALGKFDEAINILKGVAQQTEKDSETQALVFITMAKALCNQEKFADTKRCLEIACGILEKKETVSPVEVSEAYSEIAMQYEAMNEFETAISLLKRTLSLLERVPQELVSEGTVSARVGWLLLFSGKVSQAIPYFESAAERLKESFGPKHFAVGYIYNNLGSAYLGLDRPQSAAQMFAVAKDILDVALGPHHADSIESCQNLSKAYGAMGSHALAIEFQQRVVDAWESHGPSSQDELTEACRLLAQLKLKARSASKTQIPMKALPLPYGGPSTRNLQADVPLDKK